MVSRLRFEVRQAAKKEMNKNRISYKKTFDSSNLLWQLAHSNILLIETNVQCDAMTHCETKIAQPKNAPNVNQYI